MNLLARYNSSLHSAYCILTTGSIFTQDIEPIRVLTVTLAGLMCRTKQGWDIACMLLLLYCR